MPLARYFGFAGSVLLALLFLADLYIPKLSAAPDRAGVDKSIIRIHSKHKWPEAIALDTSLPTIVPPPVITAELPARKTPHDALALLPPEAPRTAAAYAPQVEAKSAAKRRVKTARVATRRIASYRAVASGEVFPAGW